MKWKKELRHDSVHHVSPGVLGRDYPVRNAHEIECGYGYNGGGKEAFGGAVKWPILRVEVSFTEGQEGLRDEIAKRVMDLVGEFFAKKDAAGLIKQRTLSPEELEGEILAARERENLDEHLSDHDRKALVEAYKRVHGSKGLPKNWNVAYVEIIYPE